MPTIGPNVMPPNHHAGIAHPTIDWFLFRGHTLLIKKLTLSYIELSLVPCPLSLFPCPLSKDKGQRTKDKRQRTNDKLQITISKPMIYENGLELKSSWKTLLQQFQVAPQAGCKLLLELVQAYSRGDRFYHTLEHVQAVLNSLDSLKHHTENLPALQLAAWFHDVIYDTRAKDNEEKSAAYAVTALNQLGIPINIIDDVAQIILDTKHHQATGNNQDSQIFLDADLAILGADDIEYRFYAQKIQREYSWMSREQYRQGRTAVLGELLQREHIYHTPEMAAKLEEKARLNIRGELNVLGMKTGYCPFSQRAEFAA